MQKYLLYIFVFVLVVACKPSRPDGILSPGKMEDILYDMHKAQSEYDVLQIQKDEKAIIAMRANILAKHDVDQAEWDSSFFYYCRNADQLYDIYSSLSERVGDEVVALGGKVNGAEGSEADTANVWKQESSFVLMQQAPYNVVSFDITPDSTFEDGDRITLQYDTKFLFQDGYRDVTTYMAVYYANDSITTQTTHSTSDGQGVITVLNDVDRLHVKKIKGFFMLSQNLTQSTSELNSSLMHLASITHVKLLHLPTNAPAPMSQQSVEKPDSLNVDSIRRDSMKRARILRDEEMMHNSIVNHK